MVRCENEKDVYERLANTSTRKTTTDMQTSVKTMAGSWNEEGDKKERERKQDKHIAHIMNKRSQMVDLNGGDVSPVVIKRVFQPILGLSLPATTLHIIWSEFWRKRGQQIRMCAAHTSKCQCIHIGRPANKEKSIQQTRLLTPSHKVCWMPADRSSTDAKCWQWCRERSALWAFRTSWTPNSRPEHRRLDDSVDGGGWEKSEKND